jgi:hypothetical protein
MFYCLVVDGRIRNKPGPKNGLALAFIIQTTTATRQFPLFANPRTMTLLNQPEQPIADAPPALSTMAET